MSGATKRRPEGRPEGRSGGRPTAEAAAQLETAILDAAIAAFLADGYAATSIEAIAKSCGVAKRTIYARWTGKPALFKAVLERLIARWLSDTSDWNEAATLQAALDQAASRILAVALTPEAIALNRLLIAESARFPELPMLMHQAGAGEGTARIDALLRRAVSAGTIPPQDTLFAAEQFFHILLAGPQRRAMGLGRPLDEMQTRVWQNQAVALFLHGILT
jgi:AcrR family transcriptional regulator